MRCVTEHNVRYPEISICGTYADITYLNESYAVRFVILTNKMWLKSIMNQRWRISQPVAYNAIGINRVTKNKYFSEYTGNIDL